MHSLRRYEPDQVLRVTSEDISQPKGTPSRAYSFDLTSIPPKPENVHAGTIRGTQNLSAGQQALPAGKFFFLLTAISFQGRINPNVVRE